MEYEYGNEIVECAIAFIAERPDKGYDTFDFCMGIWKGWRETNNTIKRAAWIEAIQTVG
jgi:hypothetical protein